MRKADMPGLALRPRMIGKVYAAACALAPPAIPSWRVSRARSVTEFCTSAAEVTTVIDEGTWNTDSLTRSAVTTISCRAGFSVVELSGPVASSAWAMGAIPYKARRTAAETEDLADSEDLTFSRRKRRV